MSAGNGGRGPAPKDASRRARQNTDPVPSKTLRADAVKPPKLPECYRDMPEVKRWWRTWVRSPQAEHFSSTDWQFLLETLPLVAAYWGGDLKQAAELRLRAAKFGATPEDRARLRMQFAEADRADGGPQPSGGSARERRGTLHALPSAASSGE